MDAFSCKFWRKRASHCWHRISVVAAKDKKKNGVKVTYTKHPLLLTIALPGKVLISAEVIYLLPKVSKLINILEQRALLGVWSHYWNYNMLHFTWKVKNNAKTPHVICPTRFSFYRLYFSHHLIRQPASHYAWQCYVGYGEVPCAEKSDCISAV